MSRIKEDIIIVGAGLTGLFLGRILEGKGKSCLILEKSSGVGGRIATRRIEGLGFDHGASFLSRDYNLEEVLKEYDLQWLIHSHGHYLEGGMNALPKTFVSSLRIRKETRLVSIAKGDEHWELKTDRGDELDCRKLIITAPIPQALELLTQNNLSFTNDLSQIRYTKALVLLMVVQDIPSNATSTEFEGHDLQLMRERNLHPQGLILRVSPLYSELLFEKSEDFIMDALEVLMKRSPFKDSIILKKELKKWRYSTPLETLNTPFVEVAPGLFLAGDGCANPFVCAREVAWKL